MLSSFRGSFSRRKSSNVSTSDSTGGPSSGNTSWGADFIRQFLKDNDPARLSNVPGNTTRNNHSKAKRLYKSSCTADTSENIGGPSAAAAKADACTCHQYSIVVSETESWTLDSILDSVIQQDNSWLNIPNPHLREGGDYPFCSTATAESTSTSSSSRQPILMPNEIILQRINNKRALHRLSLFKLQQSKLQCRKCSHMHRTILKLIIASFLFNKTKMLDYQLRCSFLDDDDYDLGFLMFQKDDYEELTRNMHNGCLYVTSERLIFVPHRTNVPEFSVPFKNMKSMTVIDSVKPKTLRRKWFFVCYWGSFVTSIEFSTFDKADVFMKMCANIRFEHTVSSCLPPKYIDQCCLELKQSAEHWSHEDNRLPTYSESEEALWKYLELRGLLKETPPSSTLGTGGYERSTHLCNLIAIACRPPSEDKHDPVTQGHILKILRQQHIPAVLKMVNSFSQATKTGKSDGLVEFLLWY